MRRKGVPCGCTDNGGCCGLKEKLAILWDRTIGSILKINDQTPDGDGKFRIQAGDNIEVSDISNGIEIGMKNPLTDNVTIQADLTVDGDIVANGDIIQNGSAYETHAEKIYTNDDYIVMRDGAVSALSAGNYSGFQVTKYDGTNDGRLVIDRDGTARVGDVGDEQPLATRDEAADLTDGHLVKWDAANLKLVDSGIPADEAGLELYDEGSYAPGTLTPYSTYSIGIPMSAGKSFETGYDYLVSVTCVLDFGMNIKSAREIETPGNSSISLQIQAGDMTNPTLDYAIYRFGNGGNSPAVNIIGISSVKLQPKLVSGTNIKTVGGQSLLGSGDVPAGGLNWTLRTANNDWTDMFESTGVYLKTKKNIFIYDENSNGYFLPKGLEGDIQLKSPTASYSSNNIYTVRVIKITASNLGSNYSRFSGNEYGITLTTDGSTISTATTNRSYTTPLKSSYKIFTAD